MTILRKYYTGNRNPEVIPSKYRNKANMSTLIMPIQLSGYNSIHTN